MYLLYCGLLVIWMPLLWPMYRLKGGARLWLLVVISAGIAALAYEIRMFLWSHAAIRLDILVISTVLVLLYGSAAALLFFSRWRKAATLLSVLLVVLGGGMSYRWIQAGQESQRLGQIFQESNRLLFQAKFRSPEIYENYFGPFTGASESYPIGHWRIEGRSHFTRLIVNAKGRVWLFYQCQEDAECHFGPEGSGLRGSGAHMGQWDASLTPQVGVPLDVRISKPKPGALSVEVRGQSLLFTKTPPPIDTTPALQSLRFLGPFAKVECSGTYVKIRQVWLWEDAARSYAIGIYSTLIAGQQSGFVSPVVMGEGKKENDGWRFAWQWEGKSGKAFIALNGENAILTLDQDGRDLEDADQAVLKGGGVFHDERIELAPLTSGADWGRWFDIVLVGHFISGYVPAC